MAILGLGTDIVEIVRIEEQLSRSDKLAQRVLTPTEFEEFSNNKYQGRFLAKRFAAKEAFVKALGTGIGQGVGWQQIQVSHYASGQPYIEVFDHVKELVEERSITQNHLSIADEQHYAIATVILSAN